MLLPIPHEELSGLSPRVWLCIGPGFAREDMKAAVLARTSSFTASAITTVQEISRKLLEAGRPETKISNDRILNSLARQEVLRTLLAEPRIGERMIELKRLRRQGTFFKKLDSEIQAGRLLFSHDTERDVLYERLAQSVGESPLRDEIRALARAYETWLRASSLWDGPALLKEAQELLQENGWPEKLARPERILYYSTQAEESLEKSFWESLDRNVQVEKFGYSTGSAAPATALAAVWNWERWHTLDDAAESFADELQARIKTPADWNRLAVLIPDIPSIRRSMLRALADRKIPLADPRDPSRLRWDETVKMAMLPLELVARNFERHQVLAWMGQRRAEYPVAKYVELVREIAFRGVRDGLRSYLPREAFTPSRERVRAPVDFTPLYSELQDLLRRFGGKKTARELGKAHLQWLSEQAPKIPELGPLLEFFEAFWNQLCEDLVRVNLEERRGAPLYWLERLRTRLAEMTPPVERLKPEAGLRIFRLQQAPLETLPIDLFIFGMPARWLTVDGGDYWFNARERDLLGTEFAVRSSRLFREERLLVLKSWFAMASSITLLDADYGEDGRERETLEALLQALGSPLTEAVSKGSHPRWCQSYSALRPAPPLEIKLPPVKNRKPGEKPSLSATALDRFSRCAFQGLALQRWKLWDLRDPGLDLWPEVRGTMLHDSVKILLRSRDPGGQFTVTPREALDRAWSERPPKGFFRSQRTEEYEKLRSTLVLENFCSVEREYFERAGTKTFSLEELKVKLEYPEFVIVGEPDRIEEHADGFFVADFKSASGQPNGLEILEKGYRLQLPFYAIALQGQTGKPVIGVQFIELTRGGVRSSGIFFERWNGKEPGKLTRLRSNVKSLFKEEPDEIWSRIEEKMITQARDYLNGNYRVAPKKESECRGCAAADLCGFKRLAASGISVMPKPEGVSEGEV